MEYNSIDDCARAMLLECANLGKHERRYRKKERGGDIIQAENGKYTWNDIQTGTPDKVAYRVARNAVAALHTHPPVRNRRTNRLNEKLSNHDKRVMIRTINRWTGKKLPHYLGTPSGAIIKFEYGKYNTKGIIIEGPGFLKF